MADRFDDLGISSELAAGVEAMGWDAPTGLQRDALPVIRRGNNVVLHASAGSGVVGAYGLGTLDRLATRDEEDGSVTSPRALILVPDDDTASRTADSLSRLAAPAGLTARAQGAGWSDRPVDALVLTPTAAAFGVRDSVLKLDGIATLVVDGADLIHATGQWDELETMVDIIPGGAQRIVVTGVLDTRINGFVERHVRKAMTVPSRSQGSESGGEAEAPVRYRVVAEHTKYAAVATLISESEASEVAVVCRTQDRADSLERALEARGMMPASGDSEQRVLVLPATEADRRTTRADVVSADPPFDAETLRALHSRGGSILVTPRERDHLVRIARRAGFALQPLPDTAPMTSNPAEAVRDQIRSLLDTTDLAADLALVEPLLHDHSAAEVAAAALHMARSAHQGKATAPSPGGTATTRPDQGAGAAAPSVGKRPGAGAPPPSDAPTWTHLFVTVGNRDDVSPGDLVGAMTGEAGVSGDQVGKIDIRESHSTVEVATPVAEAVIQALNGRTLKGRSLRVDYDRKGRTARKPSGGRPPRGGDRGGDRGGRGGGRGGGRPPRRG